jgi:hypothetical protein
MQTNNAETITEAVTEQATNDTASTEDTSSTTEVSAIEEVKTSKEGEQSSSAESEEQATTESDLYYEIDGEEVSASTVAEWRKGHMLQSDYTKKSQANAEMRKTLEAKMAESESAKEKLSDIISELEAAITKDSNPEELDDLLETDASEYIRREKEIAKKQELKEKAKKELADLESKKEKDRISSEAAKLLEAMPDWKDPTKLKADQDLIDSYLETKEFSDDDMQGLSNHKFMLMARDAALYQKLQKDAEDTEKQVQKAPNVVKAKVKETRS